MCTGWSWSIRTSTKPCSVWAKVEGPYHERVMWPLASQLWTAARAASVDIPLVLRSVWKILEANSEPPAEVVGGVRPRAEQVLHHGGRR